MMLFIRVWLLNKHARFIAAKKKEFYSSGYDNEDVIDQKEEAIRLIFEAFKGTDILE